MADSLSVRYYCYLSGNGRCDSPGLSAKYLNYSILDQAANNTASMSVTQLANAGDSNKMEILGSLKRLSI